MGKSVFRTLYNSLWTAATPVLRHHKRLKNDFDLRLVPPNWPYGKTLPAEPKVWIQAASGGESTLVSPLIQQVIALWRKRKPHSPLPTFLCTTCTEQGLDVLKKSATDLNVLYRKELLIPNLFPLDAPDTMQKALEKAQPQLIILLETELWPGLIHEATCKNIPYCIVNGRMTKKTFSAYSRTKKFFTAHPPALIITTTTENAGRFSSLFDIEALQVPNIKFDLASQSLLHQTIEPETDNGPANHFITDSSHREAREKIKTQADVPLVVLASVRKEEEKKLIPLIQSLVAENIQKKPIKCIIAPRHLHRVSDWQKILTKADIPYSLYSSQPSISHSSVTLWDNFGNLPMLYNAADAVFVGGSLAPLGGQNFLEPLAAGIRPVIGSSWHNFDWAGVELIEQKLVAEATNAEDVLNKLLLSLRARLYTAPSDWTNCRMQNSRSVKKIFYNFLTSHTGGSVATAEHIVLYLQSLSK